MKLFVQARKDGYNVLFPNPTPTEFYRFASDIQSSSANNDSIYYGKNFFTLAFTNSGCIFSKYIIGYDTQRNNLGNIGISVFIPNTRRLPGNEMIILLDDLLNTYCKNYCQDNNITGLREEWHLFTSLADRYEAKLRSISVDDIENIQSGDQDNSFIFYKDNDELERFFDAPYQEEYAPFRQIIFISDYLKGKIENPLNVLRHSENDLTGKVDLDNPPYKLREFHGTGKNGVEIKIQNSRGRLLHNKDRVFRKEELTLVYSKKYHYEKRIVGSLYNNEELRKYLVVSDNKIDVDKEIELIPETKTISFDVITKKDNIRVFDAEIQFSEYQIWQRLAQYTFRGEELGKEIRIVARKGEYLYSAVERIKPIDITASSLTLQLIEKRIVKIIVADAEGERNNILDFKVWVSGGKCNTQRVSEVTFEDEEIDKTWNITVEKDGYKRSNPISYCPKDGGSTIHFKLYKDSQRKTIPTYSPNNKSSSDSDGKPKSLAEKIKNSFSKPIVILGSIVGFALLFIGIWALYQYFDKNDTLNKTPLTPEQIEAYVEGEALILDTLDYYKENWEEQKPKIETLSVMDWYNPMTWFVSNSEEIIDSTDYLEWNKSTQILNEAIKKRRLINDKKFDELLKQNFSNKQISFISTIEEIDQTEFDRLGNQLGEISTFNLTEIADKIHEILKKNKSKPEELTQSTVNNKQGHPSTNPNNAQQNQQKTTEKQKTSQESEAHGTVPDNTIDAIIQYLKSDELKKDKLNDYLNDSGKNSTLKASINLCLELWRLDGKKNNSYSSYQGRLAQDTNLKKSKLKEFVDQMCQKEKPKYIKELPISDHKKPFSQLKKLLVQ